MVTTRQTRKTIQVCAHWCGLEQPVPLGLLHVTLLRGKEIFSFEYDSTWLNSSHSIALDPDLRLFSGQQYARDGRDGFGLFLDSAPDRWGRVLMQRREAQQAKVGKGDPQSYSEVCMMVWVEF